MKVKNIAFYGVMATILSVGGAYADNSTIIASKNYVDNTTVAKEQGSANANKVMITNSSGSVVPGTLSSSDVSGVEVTANKETGNTLTDSTTKYPSSHTVKSAIDAIDVTSQLADYQTKTDSYVDANGNYIAKGNEVGKNLKALDTNLKTVANATAGLKSAAYTESTDYATAAQGAKADTAVQPAAISDMLTQTTAASTYETKTHAADTYQPKGSYQTQADSNVDANGNYIAKGNEVGKNLKALDTSLKTVADATAGLKSAAYTESTDYATAAQGAKADTAVQPAAISDMETKTHAADTYQPKGNYQAAGNYQLEEDSKVASNGNYILAGHEVAKNLGLLDTGLKAAKDVADGAATQASTNATNIGTIGSLATTATDLVGAINEVRTTANGRQAAISNVTDTATNQAVKKVDQTNGRISVTRGTITYAEGMDKALANINTPSGEDASSACTSETPCVLSFYGDKYFWTNMDLGNN